MSDMPPGPHQALLLVSPELWLTLLQEGSQGSFKVVEHGLPADVTLVSCYVDELRYGPQTICLILESQSFPATAHGLLPILPVPEVAPLPFLKET